jgi:hypothetical protein
MESEQRFKDRKVAERLMVALGKLTAGALKTLQDKELDHLVLLLAEAAGACGRERSERPKRTRQGRK